MPSKTTRAFRTISEAGEELGLQPHVLRFWESKFPQIKPMKRGGGRRFYRPEDIEFIRGIKILLHDEKHPIKDVQKLIRKKGAASVVELGRSKEMAAQPKDIEETVLVPKRIIEAESKEPQHHTKNVEREASEQEMQKTLTENSFTDYSNDKVIEDIPEDPKLNAFQKTDIKTQDSHSDSASHTYKRPKPIMKMVNTIEEIPTVDRKALENALTRLTKLRARWDVFRE